jgi:hypothetical protein
MDYDGENYPCDLAILVFRLRFISCDTANKINLCYNTKFSDHMTTLATIIVVALACCLLRLDSCLTLLKGSPRMYKRRKELIKNTLDCLKDLSQFVFITCYHHSHQERKEIVKIKQ